MRLNFLSVRHLVEIRCHLKRGDLFAYPTESCYALGCDPRNYRAVRALQRLKQQPQNKGLIVLSHSFSQLRRLVAPLTVPVSGGRSGRRGRRIYLAVARVEGDAALAMWPE